MKEKKEWRVYIVRCKGGALYTGIAKDIEKRVKIHNDGLGAKFTRSRRPVALIANSRYMTKSAALKHELKVKKAKRDDKVKTLCPGI